MLAANPVARSRDLPCRTVGAVRPDHATDGLGGGASASRRHPPKGFGNCGYKSHPQTSFVVFGVHARGPILAEAKRPVVLLAQLCSVPQVESQKGGNSLAVSGLQNMSLPVLFL